MGGWLAGRQPVHHHKMKGAKNSCSVSTRLVRSSVLVVLLSRVFRYDTFNVLSSKERRE